MRLEIEIAAILLESNAVTLRPEKPFKYASGILSPIYCDNRLLISLPQAREKIIEAFIASIKNIGLKFDTVAGTATAGIPHAAWIADRLKKPMIYVRSESKDHGKENFIEGTIHKGEEALVVEDLISTGGSVINAVNAIRNVGAIANNCLAIFTYEMKKAKDAFKGINCKLYTLTNFTTLVKLACEKNYISKENEKTVLEWNQDPQGWARKMGFE
jgi:orotate phosphoribosyltransferase